MAETFIILLQAIAALFKTARGEVKKALIHSVVYVIVFLFFYVGYNVILAKGDVQVALERAFIPSKERDAAEDSEGRKWQMQNQLKASAKTDRLITQILQTILDRSPGAARVEFSIIHDGISGITGIDLLRYDVINGVASPGRARADAVANMPLGNWADFSRSLFAGDCLLVDVAHMQNAMGRTDWQRLNVEKFLTCPVIDVQSLVLGAVFISWDQGDVVPDGKEMQEIIAATREQTGKLGAAMDMRQQQQAPD